MHVLYLYYCQYRTWACAYRTESGDNGYKKSTDLFATRNTEMLVYEK